LFDARGSGTVPNISKLQPASRTDAVLAKVLNAARVLGRGLVQLVYPNVCWICAAALHERDPGFCESCRRTLVHEPFAKCPRCAGTVGPYVEIEPGCVNCRDASFAFDGVVRLGPYEGLLRETILRLKNLHGEGLAERLGQLSGEHSADELRALKADVIVSVPLHWRRRLARGYNQSEALARGLGRVLGIPVRSSWLRRARATPAQAAQTGRLARQENLRGAFRAGRGLSAAGKTVLLVDDVMTTGSTAHEAARALKGDRPKRILVAVLARATPT
jgi:ComF family protein